MIGKIFGDYKIIKEEKIKKEKNYILECLVCGAKLNCRVRTFDKYKQEKKCGFSKECKKEKIKIGDILGDTKIIDISKKMYNDGRERTILKRKCLICHTENWIEYGKTKKEKLFKHGELKECLRIELIGKEKDDYKVFRVEKNEKGTIVTAICKKCKKIIKMHANPFFRNHHFHEDCLKMKSAKNEKRKDGIRKDKQFLRAFQSLKDRTTIDRTNRYAKRGIKNEFKSYEEFYKKMFISFLKAKRIFNEEVSLDRINVNGNYSVENCRWTNKALQNNNTERDFGHFIVLQNKNIFIKKLKTIKELKFFLKTTTKQTRNIFKNKNFTNYDIQYQGKIYGRTALTQAKGVSSSNKEG